MFNDNFDWLAFRGCWTFEYCVPMNQNLELSKSQH